MTITKWNNDKKCPECKQTRLILANGLCHECAVAADERDTIIIDGEVCVPGGFRL